jgi:hypothetical protein
VSASDPASETEPESESETEPESESETEPESESDDTESAGSVLERGGGT